MQATELSSSSFGFSSILSRRRDQVHSMETNIQETDLGLFQKQVSDRFHVLAAVDSSDLLSMQWIQKLLDTFLCCLEEFKAILFNNKTYLNKPPMDKYLSDFLDRSVKALDVCNAIRDGIEHIRLWQKQLEIVLCALDNQRSIGEGQIRRAKKALIDLAIGMLDEKGTAVVAKRNRSFGRNDGNKEHKSFSNFRSLSWSVSRTWSAAKQLQAIGSNLAPPKGSDIVSSNGLSVAVFTMNNVLLFMMWALVAAIPCQDRGLQTHFNVTRQFIWASPIISLHERILEESKKRDRRNACGLMKEIQEVEKCARVMNAWTNSVSFPLSEEKEEEAKLRVEEVRMLYKSIKDGLEPLERQVREVFHRIVRCRTEGLDSVGKTNGHS